MCEIDNDKQMVLLFPSIEGDIRGNIREEYEFTVLLLLSGAIKYIPPKQQRKTSHVEYKLFYFSCPRLTKV